MKLRPRLGSLRGWHTYFSRISRHRFICVCLINRSKRPCLVLSTFFNQDYHNSKVICTLCFEKQVRHLYRVDHWPSFIFIIGIAALWLVELATRQRVTQGSPDPAFITKRRLPSVFGYLLQSIPFFTSKHPFWTTLYYVVLQKIS